MHRFRSLHLALALFALPIFAAAQSAAAPASAGPTILHAAEAAKLLPSAVFYDGQSANTQLRNSAGVHWSGTQYTLAVLVDNSGYSTSVQQKYQGYLLTEVPLAFGDHNLPAGAYGVGFVSGQFNVMDIGNNDLFAVPGAHDEQMRRPMPLQIVTGSTAGSYRLCLGRNCVDFHPAQ